MAANARISFHVQQATLSVYFLRLGGFFDGLAAQLLPLHVDWNDDRKTAAPALFRFYRWLPGSPLIHCEPPPNRTIALKLLHSLYAIIIPQHSPSRMQYTNP